LKDLDVALKGGLTNYIEDLERKENYNILLNFCKIGPLEEIGKAIDSFLH
jgi:hypothetical protein